MASPNMASTASGIRLDQYDTREDVAACLYGIVEKYFDLTLYEMVEPSGGMGSFLKLMPFGSRACDLEPKYPDIETADFLTVKFELLCSTRYRTCGNVQRWWPFRHYRQPPPLAGIIRACAAFRNGVTEIGVFSFSRLFRDHFLLKHHRRRLKRAGVCVVAITQEVGHDVEGDLV